MSNFHTLEDLSHSSQTQVQLCKKILDLGIVNARENLFYQIWLILIVILLSVWAISTIRIFGETIYYKVHFVFYLISHNRNSILINSLYSTSRTLFVQVKKRRALSVVTAVTVNRWRNATAQPKPGPPHKPERVISRNAYLCKYPCGNNPRVRIRIEVTIYCRHRIGRNRLIRCLWYIVTSTRIRLRGSSHKVS